MKKFRFLAIGFLILLIAGIAYATTIKDDMTFEGAVALPTATTLNGVTLTTGTATAWDDITDPDAAGTIAMTTYFQTLTSTATATDGFNFQGLGVFGDVSVVRIEQLTGNATDGTVLEVVAADANVDPLVVSSQALANAFVVGQGVGATTINGALTANAAVTLGDNGDTVAINSSDWDINATGAVTGISSVTYDNLSGLYFTDVTITAAQVKALNATPKVLIAGTAGKIIEFVSAVFVLNYGSEVFTETADNLVIEYEDGRDITAAIETTGFIDQAADQVAIINAADVPTMTAAAAVNKNVELYNPNDEIAGNASEDSVLTLKVTYRLHDDSL